MEGQTYIDSDGQRKDIFQIVDKLGDELLDDSCTLLGVSGLDSGEKAALDHHLRGILDVSTEMAQTVVSLV
jgi:hypothetical protein